MAEAGKDATDAFEDVGHSEDALSKLPGMLVGQFAGSDVRNVSFSSGTTFSETPSRLQELKKRTLIRPASKPTQPAASSSNSDAPFP